MTPEGAALRVRERVRIRSRRRRSHRRWRRRLFRVGLLSLGALAVVATLDVAWVVTTAGRELRATRDRLQQGADALTAGRLDDADTAFTLAGASADRVTGALHHPSSGLAAALPVLGDDVRAVRALAGASALAADAGRELVDAARGASWDGSTVPGLVSGGVVDTGAIAAAAPALDRAGSLLGRAERALAPVETDGLFGSIADVLVTARRTLASRDRLVTTAGTLSRLLPAFLGDPDPRRYLMVMQNLADPRGSGGYPGSYALLEATGGRIELRRMAQMSTLRSVPRVEAPPDVVSRYARFGALTHFIATTYSPDFPTSARLLMQLWEASGRPAVDGVIAVDSVWMSYVLSAIGPVETPAWPQPITAESVSDLLDRQTFETRSQTRSDRLQNALGAALWSAVLERPLPAQGFADAVARAARERHLQVYSADPGEEQMLDELGASGRIELGENPLLVAWDGGVASRAGYFAEKRVDHVATLRADGSADVSVTVTLTNPAPEGPPSILLGLGAANDVPIGHYAAFVNVYLPPAAEQIDARGGSLHLVEREFGRPVVLGLLGAAAGGSDVLRVTYRVPGVLVRSDGGDVEYRLDVVPLPALRPDLFRVTVVLPPGSEVVSHGPGTTLEEGTLVWDQAPTTPASVWVRFRVH
jgi:hypothetical protein